MPRLPASLLRRAKKVKLLLMDVDGVLTDGKIYYLPGPGGKIFESKTFHSRDGAGIRLAHLGGIETGIITGRKSRIVSHRAQELGIRYLHQGAGTKGTSLDQILEASQLQADQVCFVGDDVVDLPVLRRVGLAIAVANCDQALHRQVHYVTSAAGGAGAIRETIELILRSQNLLKTIIERIASNKSSLVG